MRVVAILGLLVIAPGASAEPLALPDRYWPAFPTPELIVRSESLNEISPELGIVLETLSGLVARRAQETGRGEYIWTGLTANPSYEEWFRRMVEHTGARVEEKVHTVWELVSRYRAVGVVQGYVLYRFERSSRRRHELGVQDVSANVATSLAGLLDAIAVDETLQAEAEAHGLVLLADVRERDEAWCLREYGEQFSRRMLALQDPKNLLIRGLAVAERAFVATQPGEVYEQALARLSPGSLVLGWGVGDEAALTGPSSRWGAFQTATNWCANLPVLSAAPWPPTHPPSLPDGRLHRRHVELRDLDWDDTSRFVSFVLSDGDNVQWLMLNFCLGREAQQYWACPDRGKLPFGWTIPLMDLAQLCPYTLAYLRETATERDDFVLLSGGYYYPDWFGANRPEVDVMAAHAARMGRYMAASEVRTLMVNAQDWDSAEALRAYRRYARHIPGLLGVLAVQYYPYTGGGGAVRWVKDGRGCEVPVVSARFALWSHANRPRDGGPRRVAQLIREWAATPVSQPEDRFGWVVDHCWSWFRRIGPEEPLDREEVEQRSSDGLDVARGYRPALWCAEALPPHVRVVTPEELLLRLRLASRPEQTLRGWLAEIRQAYGRKPVESPPSPTLSRAARDLWAAHRALQDWERGKISVEAALAALQQADRAVLANACLQEKRR